MAWVLYLTEMNFYCSGFSLEKGSVKIYIPLTANLFCLLRSPTTTQTGYFHTPDVQMPCLKLQELNPTNNLSSSPLDFLDLSNLWQFFCFFYFTGPENTISLFHTLQNDYAIQYQWIASVQSTNILQGANAIISQGPK